MSGKYEAPAEAEREGWTFVDSIRRQHDADINGSFREEMGSHQVIEVSRGDATEWNGHADVILTHPYAPLPASLHGKPSIINLYHRDGHWEKLRKYQAEEWLGGHDLHQIGQWGRGLRNTVYVANMEPRKVTLDDLIEDEFEPNVGWFPLELPMRLLKAYDDIIKPGMTVWDGFCGRGSVGKACQELGLSYIGIDIDPSRVKLAREYLGLDPGP